MRAARLLPHQLRNLEKLVKQHVSDLYEDDNGWNGICPFCKGGIHHERKFYMEMETGISICHRAVKCGWKGNPLAFISEILDIGIDGAREYLEEGGDGSAKYLLAILDDIDHRSSFKGSQLLPNTSWIDNAFPFDEAYDRLQDDVMDWFSRRGYEDLSMLPEELWLPPEGLYEGRVMFRVSSHKVSAYQLYDYTGKAERKTLNPREGFLSRTLYGYDSLKHLKKPLLIHEGIFDVLRSLQRGYNATCVFGTNMSEFQKYLLSQVAAEEIVICLDGDTKKSNLKEDKAWQMAQSLSNDFNVSLMRLPLADDPDSCEEKVFSTCFDKRFVVKGRDRWLLEKL